jgi:homoserine kinase
MRLSVSIPATVANLGPGFDCMGLALELRNELTLETDVEPAVVVHGEGAGEIPEDATNMVFRAVTYLAREVGGRLPSFRLESVNRIPLERGLGSSSAAVVGGLLLADRLLGSGLARERLLEVAVDIEGHPDNVAACLWGGLTLAYLSDGGWRAESLQPSPSLRPVVLVPEDERVITEDARRVLPRQVPRDDAVFNVGRAALTVVALTGRPELLPEALKDRLHQPYRFPLMPASRALFGELRQAGFAVCVAGSGPSLLLFEQGDSRLWDLGPGWRVLPLSPAAEGAAVHQG